MKSYLDRAREYDQEDPLRPFQSLFKSTHNEIYLDGNSLGKLPLATIERVGELVENEWGNRLIRSWNEKWLKLSDRIAAKIARIVGAEEGEIFVGDSTSLNLYKLAFATLDLQKDRYSIVTDNLNFPSDHYILQGLINNQFKGHQIKIAQGKDDNMPPSVLLKLLDEDTALLTLSHVAYKSAFRYDMEEVNRMAKDVGAKLIWDLSHSAGALKLALKKSGAEMAVGCTYKYLNGGPGAPAFLYVSKDLQGKLENSIWSWFSHKTPFTFDLDYESNSSINKFAVSTPSILSLGVIEPGLDLILEAGMKNIAEKSKIQSEFLLEMIQDELVPRGFKLRSPINAKKRGSHIAISHPNAYLINRSMIEPLNAQQVVVIPDFRPPDLIRLAITPLYTSFMDIFQAVMRIAEIVDTKEMDQGGFKKLVVT